MAWTASRSASTGPEPVVLQAHWPPVGPASRRAHMTLGDGLLLHRLAVDPEWTCDPPSSARRITRATWPDARAQSPLRSATGCSEPTTAFAI